MSFACTAGSYLAVDQTLFQDEPLTFICWFKRTGTANQQTLVMIGQKDQASGNHSYQLAINSSDAIFARTESASGASTSTTGMSVGNDTASWHFAAFRSSGNASRYAQLDTTLSAENTSNISVTGANVNCLRIGNSTQSGGVETLEALIAHVAVWNTALSDADLLLLAGGDNPLAVSGANLVAYWPLDINDITDVVGSLDLTNNGATFNASNPTVDAPPSGSSYSLQVDYRPLVVEASVVNLIDNSSYTLTVGNASAVTETQDIPFLYTVPNNEGEVITAGQDVLLLFDNDFSLAVDQSASVAAGQSVTLNLSWSIPITEAGSVVSGSDVSLIQPFVTAAARAGARKRAARRMINFRR